MPKFWLTLVLFLSLAIHSTAQNKRLSTLTKACKNLDSALIEVAEDRLQSLLHPKLSLGHSNGLIENKSELLQHLRDGYLNYDKIEGLDTPVVFFYKKLATVRRDINVKGELQKTTFDVKLRVMETWLWQNAAWRLVNRQSTKIN